MSYVERSTIGGSFLLNDLIQLPRFDAVGAVALGEKLIATANAEPELSRSVRRAKEALEEELAILRRASEARIASAPMADPTAVAEADRWLDTCWTALHDWLTGFAKLPDGYHEAAEARALLGEIYPDGLSFTMLQYDAEWNQSDMRLARIATESLGERIRALGGQAFIDALRRSHATYGKLLGLPRPPPPKDQGAPSVGAALESFTAALRVYALKVTADLDIEEPQTADLSMRLMEPLLHWEASPRGE